MPLFGGVEELRRFQNIRVIIWRRFQTDMSLFGGVEEWRKFQNIHAIIRRKFQTLHAIIRRRGRVEEVPVHIFSLY